MKIQNLGGGVRSWATGPGFHCLVAGLVDLRGGGTHAPKAHRAPLPINPSGTNLLPLSHSKPPPLPLCRPISSCLGAGPSPLGASLAIGASLLAIGAPCCRPKRREERKTAGLPSNREGEGGRGRGSSSWGLFIIFLRVFKGNGSHSSLFDS